MKIRKAKRNLRIRFTVLVLVLLIFYMNLCLATPSFKLGVVPDDYSVDKGEPFSFVVAISGNGNLSSSKILLYSDDSVLFDNSYNYLISPVSLDKFSENKNVKKELMDKNKNLNETHIIPISTESINELCGGELLAGEFEVYSDEIGDHKIIIIFTYSENNIDWYTDRLEFEFHVNSFWDNHGGWISSLGVIFAFLALLPGFSKSIKSFIEKIKIGAKQ